MSVAAVDVIEAFGEQTFLAAFSVREGWWILAVRGGIIVKDELFSNVDEAQKGFAELNTMPNWNLIVAPTDWQIANSTERNLTDIVSGSNKYKLSNISNLPGYVMTAIIFFAAVFLGYNFFEKPIKKMFVSNPQQLNINPKLAEQYKKSIIPVKKPVLPSKVIHVVMPYEKLPDLILQADQCWRAIAFLSQQITGWVSETVVCADGEVNAHLLRNHGTIGDLYDEVFKKMPGAKVNETLGNDVIISAKLKKLDVVSKSPQFTADEIMTAVQSVFQKINEDVDFSRDYAELTIPKTKKNEVLDTDKTDFPIVKILSTSKIEPREFIKIMNDVGSARLASVKWDNTNRTWNYDVVIYVKN